MRARGFSGAARSVSVAVREWAVNDAGMQSSESEFAKHQAPELNPTVAADVADCWNRIGVYGNGTCPELKSFVHCRNCPVYANAGRQALNRVLPQDYRRLWTRHFAQEKKITAQGDTSAVLFRISGEWFGLPTQAVREAAERRPVHSLPHRAEGIVLGLTNVRGELLVCVSLGHMCGLDRSPSRETLRRAHDRLLVASWNGTRFVFPADEVQGTHRFQAQELKAPPATVAKSNPTYTQGVLYWKERTVGLLDADRLFGAVNRSLT